MTDELFHRLEASGQLPTPPGVVVRLLELTRRTDVSAREIAETISLDPSLTAKILRFVNSPLAGVGRTITSLQQAVALVGARGVKMMALSFSVLSPGKARQCRGFDPEQFALQSLGCGVAARMLANWTQPDQAQETFLAGLLSQIGRSILAGALPEEYAAIMERAKQEGKDVDEIERDVLGTAYPAVGAALLRRWGIADSICEAIEHFRSVAECSDPPPLARTLHVANEACHVICPDHPGEAPDPSRFFASAGRWFDLSTEQLGSMIQEIAVEIERTRQILDFPRARMYPLDLIESEVRERLAELSVAMNIENRCMVSRQEELIRRATTDALTGVGNRAAFDARLSLELERAVRARAPFALLMLDVDRFKSLNDTYGHQAGDRVLQRLARVLDDNVRKVDYVARYGGEEFAVIAPDTSAEGAGYLAERLREGVESTSCNWEGKELKVTISIGVAVYQRILDAAECPTIIKTADARLYAAKASGRNRVEVSIEQSPVRANSGAG